MIIVNAWGVGARAVGRGVVGRGRLGASRGGAVDLASFDLGNRLVGNRIDAWAIETSGGTALTFTVPTMVALTGALCEAPVVDGPAVGWGAPVVLPAGASLRIRRVTAGTRVYVAVRGGVSVDGVSVDGVSVDGVSVDGEHLHIGADPGTAASVVAAARRELTGTVRVWPGPRVDWFADGSFEQLCRAIWSVTTTSRVGVRLVGSPLARRREGELPSEGIVEGAVQVPPDGQPIVMLADHPTTGGYPVIAVVDPKDLAEAAQAAPGTTLRFTRV